MTLTEHAFIISILHHFVQIFKDITLERLLDLSFSLINDDLIVEPRNFRVNPTISGISLTGYHNYLIQVLTVTDYVKCHCRISD